MATDAIRAGAGEVSVGRVLSRTFAVIAANPVVMLGVSFLLGALPSGVMGYFTDLYSRTLEAQPTGFRDQIVLMIASGVISLILAMIVQGALVRATVAHSEGRRASFGESVSAGMRVVLPLLGLAIVVGLAVMLGFALLIIPGIILYTMWAVASPVLVEERSGVFGALSRSRALTKGARWKVFALNLVVVVAIWALFAISGVTTVVAAGGFAAFEQGGPESISIVSLIVNALISTALNAFWSASQTSLYVELRDWQDGPKSAHLGDIFA